MMPINGKTLAQDILKVGNISNELPVGIFLLKKAEKLNFNH
jgi:hypothetical protein